MINIRIKANHIQYIIALEKAKQKNPVFKFSKFSKYYIQYQPAHSISYQQYDDRIGSISKSYEGPSFGY